MPSCISKEKWAQGMDVDQDQGNAYSCRSPHGYVLKFRPRSPEIIVALPSLPFLVRMAIYFA